MSTIQRTYPRTIPLPVIYSENTGKRTIMSFPTESNGVNLIDLYTQKQKEGGLIHFKRALADLSKQQGISYTQALQLREIFKSNEGFNLNGVSGFWDNQTTAQNMTNAALDNINSWNGAPLETNEFREAREIYLHLREKKEKGNISFDESFDLKLMTAKIAEILRSEILNKEGSGKVFLKENRLSGLTGKKREFLEKQKSLGTLLRVFLPGIIEEGNPYAIQPHELEYEWWDNKDYAEGQVHSAFCKLPGFKEHLKEYLTLKSKSPINQEALNQEISKMSQIIKAEILEKDGKGTGFIKKTGLSGLVGRERVFLDKQHSLGALIRTFLPGIIDERNSFALKPHQVEDDYWKDTDYSQRQVYKALLTLDSFNKFLECRKQLGTEANGYSIPSITQELRAEIVKRHGRIERFTDANGLSGLLGSRNGFPEKVHDFNSMINVFLPRVIDSADKAAELKATS